jgi:hypothetical protein
MKPMHKVIIKYQEEQIRLLKKDISKSSTRRVYEHMCMLHMKEFIEKHVMSQTSHKIPKSVQASYNTMLKNLDHAAEAYSIYREILDDEN